MTIRWTASVLIFLGSFGASAFLYGPAVAQLIDRTLAPNAANEGIAKSLADQTGAGRGDVFTPGSSAFIIARDPFRAVRRGRQLFQRKFTRAQGQGPLTGDGAGDVNTVLAIGAGLVDSCAGCHGRPRGSAGSGGNVVTRPDSRDAPHLFGAGIKEMLGDEITTDLRAIRTQALAQAHARGRPVAKRLTSKGIDYGALTANPDGTVDTSRVSGVDTDLRVRPFFAHGGQFSLRGFVVGAFNDEVGVHAADPDLRAGCPPPVGTGGRVVTPSGLVLDGSIDTVNCPPAGEGEIDPALVDYLEFYLLNYFRPATYEQSEVTEEGRRLFGQIGCARCHVPNLEVRQDRRVADVSTTFDPERGIFNALFATATPLHRVLDDGHGLPTLKPPLLGPFPVRGIYTDLKRHDLGPNFHERNYDGTIQTEFMTAPLWGVGSTAPYGHDGRSINLSEVILRHGGEAQGERDHFARLPTPFREAVLAFLNALILFPPDDTASNLNPGNPGTPGFPQFDHGSIKLTVLFDDPSDPE
jgi:Di-haem oxidoreductase, putative peroxidase